MCVVHVCVCVLAVVSRCWFIYIQHCMRAHGQGRGKPMEDGNSSDRKSEPGDILAVVNEQHRRQGNYFKSIRLDDHKISEQGF